VTRGLPTALAGEPVRLHRVYRSSGALLRELSRAVNQERTVVRVQSGLPAGSRLVLSLSTPAVSQPIQVGGTVTACRPRRGGVSMSLRYDFDPDPHRSPLREALRDLRRVDRGRRREARVPLAVPAAAGALLRGLQATLHDASRAGARIELFGPRLPAVAPGDRLVLTLAGSREGARRPRRMVLEAMWTGPARRHGRERRQEVGGRFVALLPSLRERIGAILTFDDARPAFRLVGIERAEAPRARSRTRRARGRSRLAQGQVAGVRRSVR
jgi:hypothetical protein